ncbi:MAG: hypothetical protein PHH83_02125 [Patescibacteria group bacterium]|nr:hypothetical protein [Patescibacteria group bacterium]
MTSEEKIFKVLDAIKSKMDLAPKDSVLNYRAGEEVFNISAADQILILNKLADEGIIEVIKNYASDFI